MKFEIPASVRREHEELHVALASATKEPGVVGEAAREVAGLMHPHMVQEEEFALPPLALLSRVAMGDVTRDMAEVLPLARRLKAELPKMLEEHRQIGAALERLRSAAEQAGKPEHARFAESLLRHAQMEEDVLYPAAILVGEIVSQQVLEDLA